jgi:DNA-binding winged helix-turn-helix (wHTH) protein
MESGGYNPAAQMSGCLRFAEFELDLTAYALRRRGRRVKLEKLPMEVLILLVREAGALVERREIQAALWGSEVFVEHDSAINTAIRKIRQALGDDADSPRYVETVIGKGYRFVARVEEGVSLTEERRRDGPRPPSYRLTRGRQEFVLQPGDNLLGRDPAARVYVDHASVSRRHARIAVGSDGATLEDLKSRNGTFVDGRRIDSPTEIQHGAIIALGPITLKFLALAEPASTRPMTGSRP